MLTSSRATPVDKPVHYAVEVVDPPYHPLAQPVCFTLGPCATRDTLRFFPRRARDTNGGTRTCVVER
jgi:hypothetical protein